MHHTCNNKVFTSLFYHALLMCTQTSLLNNKIHHLANKHKYTNDNQLHDRTIIYQNYHWDVMTNVVFINFKMRLVFPRFWIFLLYRDHEKGDIRELNAWNHFTQRPWFHVILTKNVYYRYVPKHAITSSFYTLNSDRK